MTTSITLNSSQQKAFDLIQRVNSGDNSATDDLCMGIFDATAGKWGTDEDFINQVLESSDDETLAKIMDRYSDVTGSELYKDIQNDYSGKKEKKILDIFDTSYIKTKGIEYTGDDDGKLSNQQTLKSIWNGIKDKALSIALIAGGSIAAPAIASAGGTALAGIFGTAAAATIATFAAPILAVTGIATAGYMIYKGVTQTTQAVKDSKNATTDNDAMNAVETGTEGIIETAEGIYIGYQSVSQLAKLTKNAINTKKGTVEFQKGDYGYQCEGSKPLEDFSKVMTEDIKSNGIATSRYAGDTYVKGNINQALATQDVHNCACVCLSNNETETHAIYHVLANSSTKNITEVIKGVMPEGFDKVTIIAGDAAGTEITANNALKAIESININAEVSFAHMNAKVPAIVSYNGQVYQMMNNSADTLFKMPEDTTIYKFLN